MIESCKRNINEQSLYQRLKVNAVVAADAIYIYIHFFPCLDPDYDVRVYSRKDG